MWTVVESGRRHWWRGGLEWAVFVVVVVAVVAVGMAEIVYIEDAAGMVGIHVQVDILVDIGIGIGSNLAVLAVDDHPVYMADLADVEQPETRLVYSICERLVGGVVREDLLDTKFELEAFLL